MCNHGSSSALGLDHATIPCLHIGWNRGQVLDLQSSRPDLADCVLNVLASTCAHTAFEVADLEAQAKSSLELTESRLVRNPLHDFRFKRRNGILVATGSLTV